MNVTLAAAREAAEEWAAYRRKLKALGPEPKAAADKLKTYFRAHPTKRVVGDVAYAASTSTGLDLDLVRAELDPKALKRCEVTRTRETLSLVAAEKPGRKS